MTRVGESEGGVVNRPGQCRDHHARHAPVEDLAEVAEGGAFDSADDGVGESSRRGSGEAEGELGITRRCARWGPARRPVGVVVGYINTCGCAGMLHGVHEAGIGACVGVGAHRCGLPRWRFCWD